MNDQAERLRQLISKSSKKQINVASAKRTNTTRVLAVTSGKGGVGKTNLTINLAISLSNLGYSVVVFDADIGLANIDVLLGIVPRFTISEVLNGNKDITEIMIDGPKGIKIIAGGSGMSELFEMDNIKREKLVNQLVKLEEYADYILIDTGAGISDTVISFVNAASEVILITTPEPTSLTDAYAMLKTLMIKGKHDRLKVIVNRATDNLEAEEIYNKLNMAANRFLKTKVDKLGYVLDSKLVTESVKNQCPFIVMYPNSNVSKKINNIALQIVGNKSFDETQTGIYAFINKFRNFFAKEGS